MAVELPALTVVVVAVVATVVEEGGASEGALGTGPSAALLAIGSVRR
jgi:hypothetical protein